MNDNDIEDIQNQLKKSFNAFSEWVTEVNEVLISLDTVSDKTKERLNMLVQIMLES